MSRAENIMQFRYRIDMHGTKTGPYADSDYEKYHPGKGHSLSLPLTSKTTDHYKLDNVYRDNPGGDWLMHERNLAAEKYAAGIKKSGSVTAGIREVFIDVDAASSIPGYLDEHLRDLTKESRERGLVQSILDNGFDITKKPLIAVNYRGDPFVLEGNHRIAAAKAAGLDYVPVELRYFAGGEKHGRFKMARFTQ